MPQDFHRGPCPEPAVFFEGEVAAFPVPGSSAAAAAAAGTGARRRGVPRRTGAEPVAAEAARCSPTAAASTGSAGRRSRVR